jgi:hypothetical protein
VTHSSVSGSAVQPPYVAATLAAMPSRNALAPQVMAYWWTSSSIARFAASLSSWGQGTSGKPCARLTAPEAAQSRDISRITDS